MAYVINDDCINCGACAAGCPVEAISEGASHMEINADVCVDCGACAGTCPVGAPNPQQDFVQYIKQKLPLISIMMRQLLFFINAESALL